MTPLVCGDRTRMRTWRSSGSSPAKAATCGIRGRSRGASSSSLTPASPYTGHFTQWFGDSVNNQNEVHHFTGSYVGSAADGSRASLHLDFHIGTSATASGPASVVVFNKVHR